MRNNISITSIVFYSVHEKECFDCFTIFFSIIAAKTHYDERKKLNLKNFIWNVDNGETISFFAGDKELPGNTKRQK